MKLPIEACHFVWSWNKLDVHVFRGDGEHRPVIRVYSAPYDDILRLSRLVDRGLAVLGTVVRENALKFHMKNYKIGRP